MNKFDRIISILILLQTKKIIKASNIADKFETSLRTVYRDINTLKNAGIPIIGDPGIGYSIMEGYRLPPVMFNEGEAMAMLTADKFMSNIADRETHEHYSAAMTKIRSVLRSTEKQALDVLDDSISIAAYKPEEHKPFLQELFKSIAAKNLLNITYEKANGTLSERTLEPLGCYHQSNKWYLVAFCRRQLDYRTFKMNRIQSLDILDESYDRSKFNLQEYLEKQNESWKTKEDAQIVEVFFEKSVVEYADLRKYYFGLIEEDRRPEGSQMKFWASSLEVMARWLMQFTFRAKVIKPDALSDRLNELSKELYNHYNTNS